jgi:Lon protease-like protein
MTTEKTLHNSDVSSKSEGWMKPTKAMEIGCIVQVTTQQRNPDGSYAITHRRRMFDTLEPYFPQEIK